jgi:Flp pilus assembly protein CpaB
MKASSLFTLTIAILLGLAAVVGAKYTGLFDRQPPPQAKETPVPHILVAKQNLFEGLTVASGQVRVRPLRPYELAHYQNNLEKYMPPLQTAAHMRILNRNVEADQPLLKEYFQDQTMPESISSRLDPNMRAVNVAVPKARSAGGLLRLGEHVDVYLTSNICTGPNCDNPLTQTACIARNCKIIVKRNNLWTVLTTDPDNKPLNFTLQANPYRAALIEFAQTKGNLALQPTPANTKATSLAAKTGSFSDPDSEEYRDEDRRVAGVVNGELTVSDLDLERIFNLKPMPAPALAPPPIMITRYSGLVKQGTTVFNADGSSGPRQAQAVAASNRPNLEGGSTMGYRFASPDGPEGWGSPMAGCATCGKKGGG